MSAWATRKSSCTSVQAPGTSYKQCQMSIPYTVACALLDGGVDENKLHPPGTHRRP